MKIDLKDWVVVLTNGRQRRALRKGDEARARPFGQRIEVARGVFARRVEVPLHQ
jgi:hypothetical protein